MGFVVANRNEGIATDHGEYFLGGKTTPERVIVDMDCSDDDVISLQWKCSEGQRTLYIPKDRLKKILE